jgi:hypothetical protein
MSAAVANPFQNAVKGKCLISFLDGASHFPVAVTLMSLVTNCFIAISVVNSFHPSAQQKSQSFMKVELDVEKNL